MTEVEQPRPYGDTRLPEKERQMETFRLQSDVSEMLAKAAKVFGCTKTYYVELALRHQFNKDRAHLFEPPE